MNFFALIYSVASRVKMCGTMSTELSSLKELP